MNDENGDIIFPLNTMQFGNITVKVPNDPDTYLKMMFGEDYMKIPKFGEFHNRIIYLRGVTNINQVYDEYIKLFRDINSTY